MSNQVAQLNNLYRIPKISRTPQQIAEIRSLKAKLNVERGQRSKAKTNIVRQPVYRQPMPSGPQLRNQTQMVKQQGPLMGLADALGTTQAGRDWAMAALHPCAPVNRQVGLPDTISASVVTPEYRTESAIAYDSSMFDTAPSSPALYDIQLTTLPIPEIDYIYRIRVTGTGPTGWSNTRVVRLPGFANPSTVANGTTLQTLGYSKHRITAHGKTLELNASALNNEGRIISGQFTGELQTGKGLVYGGIVSASDGTLQGTDYINSYQYRLPSEPESLVVACPKAYEEQAVSGAYVVHRFDGPLAGYPFAETGGYTVGSISAPLGGTATSFPDSYLSLFYSDTPTDPDTQAPSKFATGSQFGAGTAQVTQVIGIGAGLIHPFVSSPSPVLTSTTYFLGLVVGSASVPGASVRVKSRLYLECLSAGAPAIGPFIHPSPIFDQQSINSVVIAGQMGPDAYPASYNSFSTVMQSVWNGIKSIARPVLKVAGLIPGVGSVANALSLGIDAGEAMETAFRGGGG